MHLRKTHLWCVPLLYQLCTCVGDSVGETAARSFLEKSAEKVHVSLEHQGNVLNVNFVVQEKQYRYQLSRFSIYADDAIVQAHTDDGMKPLDIQDSHTFRSRVDDRWASAALDGPGISGIFQDGNEFIELKPYEANWSSEAVVLLAGESTMQTHHATRFAGSELSLSRASMSYAHASAQPSEPSDPVSIADPDDPAHDTTGFNVSQTEDLPPSKMYMRNSTQWIKNLVKWYPTCYTGDRVMHTMALGIVNDISAWNKYKSRYRGMAEAAIAQASLVYEKQIHIQLKIGFMTVYESTSGAPSFVDGCPGDFHNTKLNQMKRWTNKPSFVAATGLWTSCAGGGRAFLGTLCSTKHLSASATGCCSWRIFAHELGHTCAGAHSFEEGQGKTGGIMDYGPGTINGVYQFNTKYRKRQMCAQFNRVVNRCGGKFVPSGGSPPPPPPPPRLRPISRRRSGSPPRPPPPPPVARPIQRRRRTSRIVRRRRQSPISSRRRRRRRTAARRRRRRRRSSETRRRRRRKQPGLDVGPNETSTVAPSEPPHLEPTEAPTPEAPTFEPTEAAKAPKAPKAVKAVKATTAVKAPKAPKAVKAAKAAKAAKAVKAAKAAKAPTEAPTEEASKTTPAASGPAPPASKMLF